MKKYLRSLITSFFLAITIIVIGQSKEQFTITTSVSPEDAGLTQGGGTFEEGDTAILNATSNIGWKFVKWTYDGDSLSSSTEYAFTVTMDMELVANFVEVEYFVNEFHDLNDNNVPGGWELDIRNPDVELADGKLQAYTVDAWGGLMRTGILPEGTMNMTFEWDGNLAYSYWGMNNELEIWFNNEERFRVFLQTAEQNFGPDSNRMRIAYQNSVDHIVVFEENVPIRLSEFHYKLKLTEDNLTFYCTDLTTGEAYYSRAFNILNLVPTFTFNTIQKVGFIARTTTDNDNWLDNISIELDEVTECNYLAITNGNYTETEDLIEAVQSEFGMEYTIADWNDLLSLADIDAWVNCMELSENQTFMLTRGGEYFWDGNRQYMVHYSSDGIPYPNYAVHDQIGPLYLGSWYGLNQQILAKQGGIEYFTNEFYDLNDNAVPEGWELVVTNEPTYLSEGMLNADDSDGNGASGGLVRKGIVPEGTNSMTFEWDGNLDYTYWGMNNTFQIKYNNTEKIRVFLQTGEYNFGPENNRMYIVYRSGDEGIIVYEEDIPIVLSDFHYKLKITDDYFTFSSIIESSGEAYFSNVFNIKQLVPSYTFAGIEEVNFVAYTTTDNDNWLDNISIELNEAPECEELIITNGTYAETDDLIAAIQNEFGMNYNIADWTDLQAIPNIADWISCMELPENQTFMLTRNGEYYYNGIRQYMVHYSSDGIPYPNYLVHDQIGPLYLGSWYGLNQQILAKNEGGLIAEFEADNTEGIAPLTVQFSSLSIGNPTSWQWDFDNDGVIDSDLQNPEWTYDTPGLYTVCLLISDGTNTDEECKLDYITVHSPYIPVECDNLILTSDQYTETDDLIGMIQGEYGMDYTIADWTDLQAISDIEAWIACLGIPENQTFMLTRNGEYFYSGNRQYMVHYSSDGIPYPNYLVHDQIGPLYLGSWYGLNQQILAKNEGGLIAEFVADITQGIAPHTVQFSDLSIGNPSSWQWDFDNDGNIDSDLQNPGFTFDSPGQYTVCLTISDGINNDEVCISEYIIVIPSYIPVECENLILTADQYTETDDLIGMVQGEYGMDYTIADWTDLQAISDIEAWISCLGIPENQTFMLTRNGEYFYSGNRQYMVHYSSDGIPYPNYLVHDQIGPLYLGSWYGLNQQILAKNEEGLMADFNANPTQGNSPLTVQFTDVSTGNPNSWQWDFDNDGGVDSDLPNPEYIYNEPGIYTVSLTVSDGENTDNETKLNYIIVEDSFQESLDVVFMSDESGVTNLWRGSLIDNSITNKVMLTDYLDGGIVAFDIYDEGQFIALYRNDEGLYNGPIELYNYEGYLIREIDFPGTIKPSGSITISPDGQWLAFGMGVNENYEKSLYVGMCDINGNNFDTVIMNNQPRGVDSHKEYLNWIDDGILISDTKQWSAFATQHEIFLWNDDVFTNLTNTDDNGERNPALSPQHDSLVFNTAHNSNGYGISKMPYIGGEQTVIFPQSMSDRYRVSEWLPSNLILYSKASLEGNYMHDLYLMSPAGNNIINLTNTPDYSESYVKVINAETQILIADFEVDETVGIAPLQVQFTDLTTGNPTSWQWDFDNDGVIDSDIQNPEFTYTKRDLYTVSLTVSDGPNSDTETKVDYILVEIPFYNEPYFSSINDVPNDQGRQVQAVWYKSILDTSYSQDNFYTIWRQDEIFGENTIELSNPSEILKHENTTGKHFVWNKDGEVWSYINTIPAVMQEQYAMVAPTLMDSCASGINLSTFKVLFHNTSAFFESEAGQGYSVDNLSPQTPEDLKGYAADNTIHLNWSEPVDEDFQYFAIYKTEGNGVFVDEPYATTISNEITDLIYLEGYDYKVSAFDFNGNQSQTSEIITSQSISINGGWSGVSSYVIPSFSEIESVVDIISNELIILQNMYGVYWPGVNINTLGEWNFNTGYYMKTSGNVTLPLIGRKTQNYSLVLNTGWSLIPVLSDCPVEVGELFNNLDVAIIKEVAGTKMYWPDMGINTLTQLLPGKAYLVLMEAEDEIIFPECIPGMKYSSMDVVELKIENILSTPNSHIVAIPEHFNSEIKPGTIITTFDDMGKAYGNIIWQGSTSAITLFGDDQTTAAKDGFIDGETIFFSGSNPETGEEFTCDVEFDISQPDHDGSFVTNGLSVVSDFKLETLDIDEEFTNSILIFPNPANDEILIQLDYDGVYQIEIVDQLGGACLSQTCSGKRNLVDVSALSTGVYLVKIVGERVSTVRKLVIE